MNRNNKNNLQICVHSPFAAKHEKVLKYEDNYTYEMKKKKKKSIENQESGSVPQKLLTTLQC